MSVPAKYLLLCEEPLPCAPGMVNPDAHYRCPEAWGAFCCMGAQWRLQYCRHKCRRLQYCLCQGGCEALLPQAYRVWSRYRGLTCALPSPFAPSPFRAGVPSRMAPVGPGRASRRRAASRLPTGPRSETRGQSRKQRFGPGLPIGETARRQLVSKASAPVGEVGRRN